MSVLLIAMLLAGDSVSPSVVPTETQAEAPKKEKKICKVDPAYTGSRMRKQLCLTEAEWSVHKQGKNAGDLKTMGAR